MVFTAHHQHPLSAPAKSSPRYHLYFLRGIFRTSDIDTILKTYTFVGGKYLNASK
jgi:hypothetical protein